MKFLALVVAAFLALFLYACGSPSPASLPVDPSPAPAFTPTISTVTPTLEIVTPLDGDPFVGQFEVSLTDFLYQPDAATNPRTEFANGKQTANAGHVHGWVFDADGNQIRFYGAGGASFVDGVYIKPDQFDPGTYKAYFQLQYDDHTPVIPAIAPDFPAIVSTVFTVR